VAYLLKLGEPIPTGIRRVVSEEIGAAVRQLSGEGEADRDEAIHEARKSVKKIRGVLRLIRPGLGDVYEVENTHFRDIGRRLSQFRDAGAMLETFDALREKYADELDGRKWAAIRRRLMARKALAEKRAHIGEVLGNIAEALSQPAARVHAWPLSRDGFPAIAPGLEAAFRGCQRAMARARKHPRPENYHEFRKRVKAHWYHVRLLEGLWNQEMRAYEKELKDLETALGEDHNLVVLQEKIQGEPGYYVTEAETGDFIRLICKFQRNLREEALDLGEELFEEKPAHFTRRIKRLWDDWQSSVAGAKRNGRPKAAVSAPAQTV
jgi:CHAD domain-containing protein